MPRIFAAFLFVLTACLPLYSQAKKPVPPTFFYDSDGNLVSNDEFVDIRMANFQYKDATVVKTLEDGTVEFRLQKVPQEGMAAPAFSVKTLDGKTIGPAETRGRVVVLNFWFIGCPACLDIEPKLNAFKAKFGEKDDIIFLALTDDPASQVKKYLAEQRFDFIQAADASAAMKMFVFSGYPKVIVIGRDGRVVYWRSTIHAWGKFESVVRSELVRTVSDGVVK